jgi:hypothetical protein
MTGAQLPARRPVRRISTDLFAEEAEGNQVVRGEGECQGEQTETQAQHSEVDQADFPRKLTGRIGTCPPDQQSE